MSVSLRVECLYWYTGIDVWKGCVARQVRVNPNKMDGKHECGVSGFHAWNGGEGGALERGGMPGERILGIALRG